MKITIRPKSRLWLYGLVVFCSLFAGLITVHSSRPARADTIPSDWQWTHSNPVVANATTVDDIAGQYCDGIYESVDIFELGVHWICANHTNGTVVGTYYSGRVFRTVVSFVYDSKTYPVYGMGTCEQKGGCIYIPATDTFVAKQNLINNYVRSLVVYKHFTQRLIRQTDTNGQTIGYSFDGSSPDYVFRSNDGYAWPVAGINASHDGNWLAVEFRERGIGLLNMTTFAMKRISTESPKYGVGSDASIEFAVTNNGNHLAMMGSNYGSIRLYDIDSLCGDEATDRNMEFIMPIKAPCHSIAVDTSTFINRFYFAFNPRFDDEGGTLDFFASSYSGAEIAVELQSAGYSPPRLDYLALGDSFTSGEGEIDDSYYIAGTNDPYEKCHLSRRSYPYLLAEYMAIQSQNAQSVACSGAKAGDIIGDDEGYFGQSNRLKNPALNLNDSSKTAYQSSAIDNFNPGRVHQIDFVRRYRPKVITIGIGGNDVGFMDKLRSCVGVDTCEWATAGKNREKTALEVQAAFNTLVRTYAQIRNASPASKIYVIGYPKVIDATGTCSPIDGLLLDPTEREFMNQGIIYINQVISAAAREVGVDYIDTQSSFSDHVLCGSEKPSFMNAIRLGDDDAALEIIGWLKVIGKESFHPSPDGFTALANTIKQAVPSLLDYKYCQATFASAGPNCPDTAVVAPQPSSYWLADNQTHGYESQRIGEFVSDISPTSSLSVRKIEFDNLTFVPGSTLNVEIHSSPVTLGTFTASDTGAAQFQILLPSDLSEGFHTLHVYGTSYSGEAVDIYQVIRHQLPELTTADTSGSTATNTSHDNIAPITIQPADSQDHSPDDTRIGSSALMFASTSNDNQGVLGATTTNISPKTDNITTITTPHLTLWQIVVGLIVISALGWLIIYSLKLQIRD